MAVFARTTCLLYVITQWKQGTLEEVLVNIYWKFSLFLYFISYSARMALNHKQETFVVEVDLLMPTIAILILYSLQELSLNAWC